MRKKIRNLKIPYSEQFRTRSKNLEPPCIYGTLFDYNYNSNPPSNFLKQSFSETEDRGSNNLSYFPGYQNVTPW